MGENRRGRVEHSQEEDETPTANSQRPTVLDHARQATADYLAHFPPRRWGGILRGALVSVYQQEERGSDAAAWLGGERDEEGKRQAGIAGATVKALREVRLLDEVIPTKEGLVVWSAKWEEVDEPEP